MTIFRHLKLKVALAIPASNELKIQVNNSAGQGKGLTKYHKRAITKT